MNRFASRWGRGAAALAIAGLFLATTGCGGGGAATASVSGKVTYEGKPVTGGSIGFSPIGTGSGNPGKAGGSTVQSDGTYTVSTYGEDDGAVIGKHKVSYTAPQGESPGPSKPPAPSPWDGLVPKTVEVEVVKGGSTIDIELVKKGK